ncbi:hypothetical protein QMA0440_01987 [Yersinia ruckeri]|nr:hypothetical protein QMA0440_01987 [Yersinia ruckeri]KFE37335.1 hypothetical protein nADLYRO1b_3294 [Yersinia ruckeri]
MQKNLIGYRFPATITEYFPKVIEPRTLMQPEMATVLSVPGNAQAERCDQQKGSLCRN